MAIKMVREPSETPNISNIDDIIPMRYAYGNQSGYVINKGNQISYTVNGLNFTINSGRLVLQGVECDIDASGVTVTIDNIATKRYYTVYLQVNLGVNTATVLATYDTTTYPNPPASDDLTANSTGVAYLILYNFTATGGIISEVYKVVQSVKYTPDIEVKNAQMANLASVAFNDANGDKLASQKDVDNAVKGTNDIVNIRLEVYEVLQFVSRAYLYIDVEANALDKIKYDGGFLVFLIAVNPKSRPSGYYTHIISFEGRYELDTKLYIPENIDVVDGTIEFCNFDVLEASDQKLTLKLDGYIQASNTVEYQQPALSEFYNNCPFKYVYVK